MADWQSPGARWLRCDLHVHTPFDKAKKFGEDIESAIEALKKGKPEKLAEIAERFIEACRSAAGGAGLDLIAITDHNSIEGFRELKPFFDEIARRAADEGRSMLTILPGVEISVGSERPLHFLIIFASDTSPDDIDSLIRHIFGAHEPFAPEDRTPRATGQSIHDFLHKVYEFCHPSTGDRDLQFVLLPAHIDGNSGAWREMKGGLRQWIISRIDWNGFQTSVGFDKLPPSFRELILRWTAAKCGDYEWDKLAEAKKERYRARRYWPLIECSDPDEYQKIGARFTWLKMEVPDVEGIRLALLDPESRLRSMEDGTPAERYARIRSLRIRGTDFFDQIEVPFSCCLTTLIGGRGSGKSTVIEYLRHALDRARSEDLSGDVQDAVKMLGKKAERDYGETQGTLLPGYAIEVDLIESDRKYRVIRTESGSKIVRDPDTPQAEEVALDARTLIKPRILSQRQIARIARDPLAQREELDALIDPDRLRALETSRIQAFDRLVSLQTARTRLKERRSTLPAKETELERLRAKIEFLEKSGGKDILARFASYQREQQWLGEVLAEADRLAESMENQAEAIEHSVEAISGAPTGTENEGWLHALAGKLQQRFADLARITRREAASLRAEIASLRKEQQKDWNPKYESASGEYAKLCEELEARGVEFSQYERLLQQRALLEREVRELRELEHDIEKTEADIRITRSDLVKLRQEYFALRLDKAKTLEQLDADVRLDISAFGDRTDFITRREQWFSGTRMRDEDWYVLADFVFSQADAVPDRLDALIASLRKDFDRTKEKGCPLEKAESEVGALIGQDLAARLTGHFYRALERVDQTRIDDMERFLPEDKVEARVRSADGTFKPIASGSVGERSTAILSLLLSAGDQPLIIDQPEDDLDNRYIYEVVVDLLRRRKFSRQIIIATHNANIPVNGDAELIVALGVENRLGNVFVVGSIDRPEVKEQVSMIMEGSAEAFRLRRERYGF